MHKQAWLYSMTAMVLGAFGVLLRWLQCQTIFDAETGLPTQGAFVSYLLVIVLAGFAAGLWWLAGKMDLTGAREEPEDALAMPARPLGWLLTGAAVLAGGGAALMFIMETSMLLRITALLGLLSAAVLAMVPSLPRWGGFGALLSVVPVVFFCLWMVVFYKENSVNPILWRYAVQILAIAACLLAAFRISGYLFYRMKPRKAIFACGLALTFSMTVLMDEAGVAARLMFLGWGIGFGAMSWLLVRNLEPEDKEATY